MSEVDFDWVTERTKCSISVMFERLRLGVEHDIAVWERLPDRDPGRVVYDNQGHYFTVTKNGRPDAPRVAFRLGQNTITVDCAGGGKTTSFHVALTLNQNRECRFVVDAEELERWQLRQKALSPLFFPQGSEP